MAVSGRRPERSFKETVGRSSAEDGENFCQPCSSDGDWVVAIGYCVNCNEYQCATCLKVHRKQAVSKNHKILEGENIPNAQECSVTLNVCSEICVKHTNEIIKYYCSTHDSVGCGDCMVLDHNVCKSDRIQDISTSYFNGSEHQKLQRTVHKFLKDLEGVNKEIQSNEKATKQTYIKALDDIKAFKKEIIEYLDSAEAAILDKLDEKKKIDDNLISKLIKETDSIRDEVQKLKEKLQLQVNRANELFVNAKQVKARLAGIDDKIQHLQQNSQMDMYEFIPSENISDIVVSRSSLGTYHLTRKSGHDKKENAGIGTVKRKSILEMELHFDGEIKIKAPDDTTDCELFACALISPSRIILADGGNKCVKVVNTEDRYLSAKYKLGSSPRGIAVISQSRVAVTLPDENKILFLTIAEGDKLTEDKHLKVNGKCNKIAYTNNKLIVLYSHHAEILSLNGKMIRQIDVRLSNQYSEDIAIAPDSMTFYVSYSPFLGPGSISKYDFNGNHIATIKLSSQLRGLFVSRDGTVLVCNWNPNGSVLMMPPEFKKTREILKQCEHVECPWSVSFCDNTNRLFICNYSSRLGPTLNNYLKIFQLK